MSMSLGEAMVAIRADASGLGGQLDGVAQKTTGRMKQLATAMTGLATSIATAFGINQLMGGAGEAIDLAETQINAERKLEGVIRATGGAAGFTADQLKKFASDLQGVTTSGDEANLEIMAMMATFKQVKGDEFLRATRAALDMGVVFGSASAASLQLGKALNDPVLGASMLSRSGITFTTQQREMIKNFQTTGRLVEAQHIILREVEGQMKGLAEEIAASPIGKLNQFKNTLGDVKEEIGKKLIPITALYTSIKIRFAEEVNQLLTPLKSFGERLLEIDEKMGGAISSTVAMIGGLAGLAVAIRGTFFAIKIGLASSGIGLIPLAVGLGVVAVTSLVAAFNRLTEGTSLLQGIGAQMQAAFAPVWQFFTDLGTGIRDGFNQHFGSILRIVFLVSEGIRLAITTVANLVRSLFGGPMMKSVKDWAAATVGSVIEFVLDSIEWFIVITRNWRTVWDNMGKIVTFGISFIIDSIAFLQEFFAASFGVALGKAAEAFMGFLRFFANVQSQMITMVITLAAKIPKLITQALTGGLSEGIAGELRRGFETALSSSGRQLSAFMEGFSSGKLPEFEMSKNTQAHMKNLQGMFSQMKAEKAALEQRRGVVAAVEAGTDGTGTEPTAKDVKHDTAGMAAKDSGVGFTGLAQARSDLIKSLLGGSEQEKQTGLLSSIDDKLGGLEYLEDIAEQDANALVAVAGSP